MRKEKCLWAILMIPVLSSCGHLAESPAESRAVIDHYFEVVKVGSVKGALESYSPEFFAKTSSEEYVRLIDKAHAKLGAIKSYSVTQVNVTSFSGTSKSGIYTTFECNVEFEKSKGVELFRVFQPQGSTKALILAHNINSPGLVSE